MSAGSGPPRSPVSRVDDRLVGRIWFHIETEDAERLAQLGEAIVSLDRLGPSVVADYWLDCSGVVGDCGFLDRYR